MRKVAAIVAAAGLLIVGLTGCSASASASADCDAAAPQGRASNNIAASGAFGHDPKVSFPTPLKTDTTERTIVKKGSGPLLVKGQGIRADITIYNATTGQLMPRSAYGAPEGTLTFAVGQTFAGITKGLICARDHSRIAVAVAPKDGTKDGATSLVIIIDVRKAYLPRADGALQAHVPGLPKVVRAPNGAPGITVPDTKAPKTLKIADVKKGDGATVKRGDTVIAQYTGVLWKDGTVFDSSWNGKGSVQLVAQDATSSSAGSSGGVIPGMAQALIGQKVGSQVLAVIPPDKAYGSSGSGAVPPNATLVFVIDVLGVQRN